MRPDIVLGTAPESAGSPWLVDAPIDAPPDDLPPEETPGDPPPVEEQLAEPGDATGSEPTVSIPQSTGG